MFLSKQVYSDLQAELASVRERNAKLEGERDTQARMIDSQQTMIGFLCARVNQVERERVVLMREVTKIQDLPVAPELRATAPAAVTGAANVGDMIAQASSLFEDVGDANARRLGIEWSGDGTLKYADPRVDAPRPS